MLFRECLIVGCLAIPSNPSSAPEIAEIIASNYEMPGCDRGRYASNNPCSLYPLIFQGILHGIMVDIFGVEEIQILKLLTS